MKIEVRTVTHREGNKNGKNWSMDFVSAIVQNDDGTEAMGEFILPREHPAVTKGFYEATTRVYANEGKLVFAIQQLTPVRAAGVPFVAGAK